MNCSVLVKVEPTTRKLTRRSSKAGPCVVGGAKASSGGARIDGCYTLDKSLSTTLRIPTMNKTTDEDLPPKSGSIAVYQRLVPGKRPAKVEILRAVYETYRDPDGRAFGRTNNTVLLRVSSGMDCLSTEDVATLGQLGLNEREIAHVNWRLSELAGPARACALDMDVFEVKAKLGWILALAEATPLVTRQVGDLVRIAAEKLEVDDDIGTNLSESAPVEPFEALKNAFAAINHSCEEAQALYRHLPKGEVPDDVLSEYQKSWFSYPDMLATFTVRKSFSRPSGWSKLRAELKAGNIHRKGVPIS